tara:strand:- start:2975 stop:3946 length:972 start_codon:yes stop_codon:yes gene_type:complete
MKYKTILTSLILLTQITFAINDTTFTSLENRLNIKLPSDFEKKLQRQNLMGPKPSEREYLEIQKKQNDDIFSISFRETYAVSDKRTENEIEEHIKNWNSLGTTFKLEKTIIKNDLYFYPITPEKLLVDENIFIYKAFFVKLDDNSLISCAILLNSSALKNISAYNHILGNLYDRISKGKRKAKEKGDDVLKKFGKDSISFIIPFKGMIVPQNSYSYDVLKIVKLGNLNSPGSELTIYYGNHPQDILSELPNNMQKKIKKRSGLIFGKKIKWQFLYPKSGENFPYMHQAFIKNGKWYFHIFVSAINEFDNEEMLELIRNLKTGS